MFKKPLIISLALCGLLSILVIAHVVSIRPADQTLYAQIKQHTQTLHTTSSLERHPSAQFRQDTRKDIWNQDRVHFQMSADQSTLTLKQKKDKIEASEELKNISCENRLGTMIAKEGSFEYPNTHFLASQVTCTHALGMLEAQSATLESTDDTLVLDEGVIFTSSNFSLQSQKAICKVEDKNQQIEFYQNIVIQMPSGAQATGDTAYYKPNHLTLVNHVHLQQGHLFSIDADACFITFNQHSPDCIEFNNNVRFYSPQENQIFALADSIFYHMQEQTLILSAQPPKRVLFWQEGMSLSAPEVHIQKQLIQGKGDVRLTFNIEEQGLIDRQITKYLYVPYFNASN